MNTLCRLVLLAALLLAGAPGARAQPAPLGELDAYFQEALQTWNVPGLAVAVVQGDSVVFAEGYGVREAGTEAAVTPQTRFLAASTTKAFTAAALGLLVEEGRLGWDDPVHEHLPDFRLDSPHVTEALTVRDLLTHRIGIARADRLWWASPFSRQEVLRRVRHLPQERGFRAGYGYNNNLYIAAGELIEAVTDTSWDAFLEKRFFEPLGMTHSNTSVRALPAEGNVATPHRQPGTDEEAEAAYLPIPWRNVDNLGGAGALNTTALDMTRWLRMLLNEGTFDGRQILKPETVDELFAAQTVIPISERSEELYPSTHFRAYGLGWFLQNYRGVKVAQHSGSLDGMRARVGLIPERGLGAVLFTNAPESDLLEALLFRIFDHHLGPEAPPRDWSALLYEKEQADEAEAQARRDSLRAQRATGTAPTLPLQRYAGAYTHDAYGTARVKLEEEDSTLVLRVGPHFAGALQHWHYNTFRTAWRDLTIDENLVTFTLGADGAVEAMKVEGWATFQRRPADVGE